MLCFIVSPVHFDLYSLLLHIVDEKKTNSKRFHDRSLSVTYNSHYCLFQLFILWITSIINMIHKCIYNSDQNEALAKLDLVMASSICADARIFSRVWLILRAEEGKGFSSKNFSISSARSFVQKRLTELTITASIMEGDAFANFSLIKLKF